MPKNSLEHIQFECHCTHFSLGPNVALVIASIDFDFVFKNSL